MKTILVTGSNGLLGQKITDLFLHFPVSYHSLLIHGQYRSQIMQLLCHHLLYRLNDHCQRNRLSNCLRMVDFVVVMVDFVVVMVDFVERLMIHFGLILMLLCRQEQKFGI